MHTHIGKFSSGPLKTMRQVYQRMGQLEQSLLLQFSTIHMSWLCKVRHSDLMQSCKAKHVRTNVVHFDTIINYIKTKDLDTDFCVKFVGALPKDIMQIYYQEKQQANYEIPISGNANHISAFNTLTMSKVEETK